MLKRKKLLFVIILGLILNMSLFSFAVSSEELSETAITGRYEISDIVEEVSPAVVNVNTVIKQERGIFPRSFFDDFFRDQFPTEGVGSGFIVGEEGYILTNEHVITKAEEIDVTLSDGTKVEDVEVVGKDAMTDIAILKIPDDVLPEDIPTAKLGDSDNVRVGEWVITIGNPYGLQLGEQHTVTAGIISAKNRTIEAEGTVYEDFLQTDAPINPGNSGGPLINLDGEVIGINTAIIPYAQGIGFAIPINKAQDIMYELIEEGRILRPWLGVSLSPVTDEIAEYLDLPESEGALIQYIAPGSPADEAGLKRGDVITEINQAKIKTPEDAVDIIQEHDIGEGVVIVTIREGHLNYISAEIGERP